MAHGWYRTGVFVLLLATACAHRQPSSVTAPPVGESLACRGTAVACESAPNCLSQDGCATDSMSRCVGTPTSCAIFTSEGTCSAQAGCYWNGAI